MDHRGGVAYYFCVVALFSAATSIGTLATKQSLRPRLAASSIPFFSHWEFVHFESLSGPLNRLNAILSLLQPLDSYRAPSAIGSAIGRPYLALSRFHAQVGALNRLVLNRFRGSTAR